MWYIYCRRTTFFILSFHNIGYIRKNIQVNLMFFTHLHYLCTINHSSILFGQRMKMITTEKLNEE